MECYPCSQAGVIRQANGICHHCSAALCKDHICEVEDPITVKHVMTPNLMLPKKARILLCETCKAALDQLSAVNNDLPTGAF